MTKRASIGWRTTRNHWGWLSIAIHWLTVLVVFSQLILGLRMVELNYYDSWYHKAPELHKSIGIVLLMLTLFRLVWRHIEGKPTPIPSHTIREQLIARFMHNLLYFALIATMVFGYLISTADGRAIEVFGVFTLPAIVQGIDKQEDIAGVIHLWLAVALICLVVVHALAAIKHHVFDKDSTLKRMFGL